MANYITCRKKFISEGKAEIELADIHINKITVGKENGKKKDRTFFLEWGDVYNTLEKQENISFTIVPETETTKINTDSNENTYIDYIDYNIRVDDKLVLTDNNNNNNNNNNNIVYCLVTEIDNILKRIYIDYYTELNNEILKDSIFMINIISYENIKETTNTYELTIDSIDTPPDYNIPIFLPKMTINSMSLSSQKNFLINIHNSVKSTNFIFLTTKNFYMNNLTKNNPYILSYIKNQSNQDNDYITFVISFLFNGKTWFVL